MRVPNSGSFIYIIHFIHYIKLFVMNYYQPNSVYT